MKMDITYSQELQNLIKNYQIFTDTEGLSPAYVFKLVNKKQTLYLKITNQIYNNTTYDVKREKQVMQWLQGKINVPEVVFYEEYLENRFLLMTEIKGTSCSTLFEQSKDPLQVLKIYADSIRRLWCLDIKDCGIKCGIDFRLQELKYLLDHNLADTNLDNWEDDTEFTNSKDLYNYLILNKPQEELTFSHGDFGGSNIIINEDINIIDLGRAGISDKWIDIAFVVREIKDDFGVEYIYVFFELLGIDPNWEKIKYFILLDELF